MVNSVSAQPAFNLTYSPATKGPGGVLELVEADTGQVMTETPVVLRQASAAATGAIVDINA
jgi:hypothetical protein